MTETVCTALQLDKSKEWPSIVGEHFDYPQPKFDFNIIDKSFEGNGYISYLAYSLTIPPEYLRITEVSGELLVYVS